jgi:hypothetical protein
MTSMPEEDRPTCRQPWRSDPSRTCEAVALPGASACLAHASDGVRGEFLACLDEGGSCDGELRKLEVSHDLLAELRPHFLRPGFVADLRGATFTESAYFALAAFSGDATFDGATFNGGAIFDSATFDGGAIFHGTTFNGPATFNGTTFNGTTFDAATFDGPATFDAATFDGPAIFDFVTFAEPATLNGANFKGGAIFESANFNKAASFDRATFDGFAAFDDATFNAGASFRAIFNGPASFGATFNESTHFEGTHFNGDARFGGTHFNGDTHFEGATFAELADFSQAFFEEAAFDLATFSGDVSFAETLFLGEASFDRATFSADANFAGAGWRNGVSFWGATFGPFADFSTETTHQTQGFEAVYLKEAVLTGTSRIWLGRPMLLAGVVLQAPLTVLARGAEAAIDSLELATLEAPLVVNDGVQLTRCKLRGATGLDRLRLVGADPAWARYHGRGRIFLRRGVAGRRVVADELVLRAFDPGEREANLLVKEHNIDVTNLPRPQTVEAVYRQLRAALEASKAAPAAADFYYGEMEMRRLACKKGSFERKLLWLYKATCGYGLRASRALATYVFVLMTFTVLFRYRTSWFVSDATAAAGGSSSSTHMLNFHRFWDTAAILGRSSVTFLSPIATGLTAAGTLMLILLRFTAPAALALAVLAVRARVQR